MMRKNAHRSIIMMKKVEAIKVAIKFAKIAIINLIKKEKYRDKSKIMIVASAKDQEAEIEYILYLIFLFNNLIV